MANLKPMAFWDPDTQSEYIGVADYYDNPFQDPELTKEIRIPYRGTTLSLEELVARLIKVEDALADYMIFEDTDGKES